MTARRAGEGGEGVVWFVFLSNSGVWVRCTMELAGFSVTCLSVLPDGGPDVGYDMASSWERSEERKIGKK